MATNIIKVVLEEIGYILHPIIILLTALLRKLLDKLMIWREVCKKLQIFLNLIGKSLYANILSNQVDGGLVREAYFKWYDLTFDYSLLRVFGNRVYALNHIRLKDYDARSVPGIFVHFMQSNPITTYCCIYLRHYI